MHEKRLSKRLTDYWEQLRKDAPLPQIEQFNHEALSDVIGKCTVWRVEVGNQHTRNPLYTCEFIGDDAKQAIGSDITGQVASPRMYTFPAARILEKINEVVENGLVVVYEGQFTNETSQIVKYRSCLLPFGNRQGKVTNIVLGISWKAF